MSSNILGPEWNLSPDGVSIVTDNGSVKDPKAVLKTALDSDLKVIGKPALLNEISKTQIGKIVLQIQKIRNISAPKAKEESQAAPRMLKLTLTDGESYVQAIEITPINSISREKTAPGTKVLINGANMISGYLLINSQNFSLLGGQVEHLYEKWILAKSIQQNHQYVSNDGAPPWVPFGCKIISGDQEKPFKSLEKNKDGNSDSEFDQQRKEAIAEASTGAVRKTFGGRVKQTVQPIQNNQQYNRGRQNDRGDNDKGGRKGKFASKDDDATEKLQKPSEKVSLFSFLEDKLPASEFKKPAAPSPSCNKNNNCQTYHQKDPRVQQRSEAKQNSRQQYDKSASNNYTNKDKGSHNVSASKPAKPENQDATVTKFLPQKNASASNDNPKSNANENKISASNRSTANYNGDVNNSSFKSSQQRYPKDPVVNGYKDVSQQYQGVQNQYKGNNDRNSQQQFQGAPNQFRSNNDRYPQYPNTNNSPMVYQRENFNQPQNNYRNSNDRYAQQQNMATSSRDNFSTQQNQGAPYMNYSRQQYPNANRYPQSQYNQKQQQNVQQGTEQNTEMHQLANNLSKMSVSNEFASRSLRQHLNLGPPKRQDASESTSGSLNVGDQCLAKYWEDGKFYPAIIAAITDKTYAVQFKGYGNIEEVLKHDCFSTANSYDHQNRNPNYNQNQNNFSGTTMEFRSRRGPPRN